MGQQTIGIFIIGRLKLKKRQKSMNMMLWDCWKNIARIWIKSRGSGSLTCNLFIFNCLINKCNLINKKILLHYFNFNVNGFEHIMYCWLHITGSINKGSLNFTVILSVPLSFLKSGNLKYKNTTLTGTKFDPLYRVS